MRVRVELTNVRWWWYERPRMCRCATASRTPIEGRLGAVDEELLRGARLLRLDDLGQIEMERRPAKGGLRVRRDPRELVRLLLAARQP